MAVSIASNDRRLVIDRVVLENFKSYAGTRVIGPFVESFNCIVGPNGSGKSNIIDALLFVFGSRAAKLRQKNVADLIHKSTACPDCTHAMVQVTFRLLQPDKENLDEPECLVIAREARSDGSSKYTVNGSTSSHKDVVSTLMAYGIDLEKNRFLVLQGEVEKIATMKPKGDTPSEVGLLEYLEDIIGTSAFLPSIEALTEQVTACQAKCVSENQICAVAKEEVDKLDGPRAEAELYFNHQRKDHIARSTKIQKDMLNQRRERESVGKELTDVEDSLRKWEELMGAEREEVLKLKEASEASDMAVAKANAFIEKTSVKYQKMDEKLSSINIKEGQCNQDIAKAQKECEELMSDIQKCEEKIVDIQNEETNSKQELPRVREDLAKAEEALDKINTENREVMSTLGAKRRETQKALTTASGNVDTAQAEVNQFQYSLDLLGKDREEALKKIEEAEKQVAEHTSAVEEEKNALKTRETEIKNLKSKIDKTSKEITTLEEKRNNEMREGGKLSQKLNVYHSNKKAGSSDAQISKIQKANIEGFIGTLWNLGTIDQEYHIAASATTNDTIITSTLKAAERIVDFCKANKLGRATILPLENLEKKVGKNYKAGLKKLRAEIPSNTKLLFDQVRTHPDYEIAFFHAIRDTIVAPDDETAKQVAFKGQRKLRVVSKTGTMCSKNGSIAGGKVNLLPSLAGERAPVMSNKEVEDLQQQQVKNKAIMTDIQQKLPSLTSQKNKLTEELNTLLEGPPTSKLANLEAMLKNARDVLDSTDVPIKTEEEAQEELKLIRDKDAASVKLEAKATIKMGFEEQIKEIDHELENAGGAKRKEAMEAVESLRNSEKKMQKSVSESTINISKLNGKIEASQKKIPELEKRIANLEKNIKRLKEEEMKIMEDGAASVNDLSEAEQALAEFQTKAESDRLAFTAADDVYKDKALEGDGFTDKIRQLKDHDKDINRKITTLGSKLTQLNESWNDMPTQSSLRGEAKEGDEEEDDLMLNLEMSDEQLDEIKDDALELDLKLYSGEMTKRGAPEMHLVEMYQANVKKYNDQKAVYEITRKELDRVSSELSEINEKRLSQFREAFRTISLKLKELYQMLTLGGDADLDTADNISPFNEGVVFTVRPPKKSWKQIQNLSGGEKTLSSLALIFALHQYKPTPIYFLDEIDAALDFKNVSIIGRYIQDQTSDVQFIIISLRNNMFEKADRLVGVYKVKDGTETCCIDPEELCTPPMISN